ncbi:MAG: lipoprotein-releasing ABC transporter permease subunit [Methylococcales bacterium]|nr:lipoprotein-releasing ABC transporter permease subunit [Methylococcales bacterium]MBT7445254.1 lipoprotein-releasing ABC transporter permease subunit [Methylococcales bacterium]
MFQSLPFIVGLRYLRAKRRNHFISFITLFSAIGIALGVIILIVVLSVMNGFEHEIRHRTLGMASHGSLYSHFGYPIDDWQKAVKVATADSSVLEAAPYVEKQVMLNHRSHVSGAIVRGILPKEEIKVAEQLDKASEGKVHQLVPGQYQILLGIELFNALNLRIGDKVTMVTPQTSVTPAGVMPRLKRFTVIGTFKVGMNQYDGSVGFVHMADAQKLFRMKGVVSGVRIKLDDMFKATSLRDTFSGYGYRDWTQQFSNIFTALAMEKTVMFIILTMIVVIAAFNIVSTLVMVVTDKLTDIAILRTMGMSPGQIMGVFMVQGTVIGFIGTVIGVFLGVLLAVYLPDIAHFLEDQLGVKFFPSDIYYISDVPSELVVFDVVKVAFVSFFLTVLATLYPAWSASKTDPAEALRYE